MVHFTTNIQCSDALLMLHSTNIPEPGLRWRRHRRTNASGMGDCPTRPWLRYDAFAAVRTAAYCGLCYSQDFTLSVLVDMMRMKGVS